MFEKTVIAVLTFLSIFCFGRSTVEVNEHFTVFLYENQLCSDLNKVSSECVVFYQGKCVPMEEIYGKTGKGKYVSIRWNLENNAQTYRFDIEVFEDKNSCENRYNLKIEEIIQYETLCEILSLSNTSDLIVSRIFRNCSRKSITGYFEFLLDDIVRSDALWIFLGALVIYGLILFLHFCVTACHCVFSRRILASGFFFSTTVDLKERKENSKILNSDAHQKILECFPRVYETYEKWFPEYPLIEWFLGPFNYCRQYIGICFVWCYSFGTWPNEESSDHLYYCRVFRTLCCWIWSFIMCSLVLFPFVVYLITVGSPLIVFLLIGSFGILVVFLIFLLLFIISWKRSENLSNEEMKKRLGKYCTQTMDFVYDDLGLLLATLVLIPSIVGIVLLSPLYPFIFFGLFVVISTLLFAVSLFSLLWLLALFACRVDYFLGTAQKNDTWDLWEKCSKRILKGCLFSCCSCCCCSLSSFDLWPNLITSLFIILKWSLLDSWVLVLGGAVNPIFKQEVDSPYFMIIGNLNFNLQLSFVVCAAFLAVSDFFLILVNTNFRLTSPFQTCVIISSYGEYMAFRLFRCFLVTVGLALYIWELVLSINVYRSRSLVVVSFDENVVSSLFDLSILLLPIILSILKIFSILTSKGNGSGYLMMKYFLVTNTIPRITLVPDPKIGFCKSLTSDPGSIVRKVRACLTILSKERLKYEEEEFYDGNPKKKKVDVIESDPSTSETTPLLKKEDDEDEHSTEPSLEDFQSDVDGKGKGLGYRYFIKYVFKRYHCYRHNSWDCLDGLKEEEIEFLVEFITGNRLINLPVFLEDFYGQKEVKRSWYGNKRDNLGDSAVMEIMDRFMFSPVDLRLFANCMCAEECADCVLEAFGKNLSGLNEDYNDYECVDCKSGFIKCLLWCPCRMVDLCLENYCWKSFKYSRMTNDTMAERLRMRFDLCDSISIDDGDAPTTTDFNLNSDSNDFDDGDHNNKGEIQSEVKIEIFQNDSEPEREGGSENYRIVKVAHISDSHVSPNSKTREKNVSKLDYRARLLDHPLFYNERFSQEVYEECLKKCVSEKVDHVVHSGDISVLGLKCEFEDNLDVLFSQLFRPLRITSPGQFFSIAPGNHEFFFPPSESEGEDMKKTEAEGEETLDSKVIDHNHFVDIFGSMIPFKHYPFVKLVSGNVLIVCLNSRHMPKRKKPFGWDHLCKAKIKEKKLEEAKKLIDDCVKRNGIEGKVFKILVMHHSPLRFYKKFPKKHFESSFAFSEKNRTKIQNFIRNEGFDLVLCGHSHEASKSVMPSMLGEDEKTLVIDAGSCSVVSNTFGRRIATFNIYHIEVTVSIHPQQKTGEEEVEVEGEDSIRRPCLKVIEKYRYDEVERKFVCEKEFMTDF